MSKLQHQCDVCHIKKKSAAPHFNTQHAPVKTNTTWSRLDSHKGRQIDCDSVSTESVMSCLSEQISFTKGKQRRNACLLAGKSINSQPSNLIKPHLSMQLKSNSTANERHRGDWLFLKKWWISHFHIPDIILLDAIYLHCSYADRRSHRLLMDCCAVTRWLSLLLLHWSSLGVTACEEVNYEDRTLWSFSLDKK